MIINGKTTVIVNGRATRILSHRFNVALKEGKLSAVLDAETGAPIVPSKGASWAEVGEQIRAGKKVVAKVEAPKAKSKRAA